jgi:hypothetical protein
MEANMRLALITSVVGAVAAGSFLDVAKAATAADWMLRVVTTSRTCNVQLKNGAALGINLKGPFVTRKEACVEALNMYDRTTSDTSKCWVYGDGTVRACGSEGIMLPTR